MPIYKSTLNTKNRKTDKEPNEKKPKHINKQQTKKIVCFSLVFISLFCLILNCFNNPVQTFLLGLFGVFSYPLFISNIILGLSFAGEKKYVANKRYIIYLTFSLFFIITFIHLILTHKIPLNSYGKYLVATYKAKTTGAGLILSLITYPIAKFLTLPGAFVLSIIGSIAFVGLTVDYVIVSKNTPKSVTQQNFNFNEFSEIVKPENINITFKHQQEDLKKKIAKQKLGIEQSESTIISSSMRLDNISEKVTTTKPVSKKEYILTPPEIIIPDYHKPNNETKPRIFANKNDDIITDNTNDFLDAKIIEQKQTHLNNDSLNETTSQILDNNLNQKFEDDEQLINEMSYDTNFEDNENILLDGQEEDLNETTIPIEESHLSEYSQPKTEQNIVFASPVESKEIRSDFVNESHNTFTKNEQPQEEPVNKLGRPKKHYAPYIKPPVDLLNYIENTEVVTDEECNENIERLEKVLEDFKIPAKVKAVQVGPAVTRYEIGMPTGISVKKVQLHADDIAMAMASNGSIRIEAPIPGKNAVGIEVPNKNVGAVSLREMIESLDYQKRANPMSFVLGKDINGTIQFCNLDKMPHLLVAGSTGSGKSVCLNTMLISMLYKSSPEDVRLILIDPKTVEFSVYANIPHLLTPHIITTKEQAINALNWAIKEMEYRYKLLQMNEVVNIKEYNSLPIVKDNEVDKLPYIVIVIDELNDLMIETRREMEERIMKLAQKSRAAGIHLVIATQRPSVDVITGTIKANLPSRIAFQLTNFADSKTVLDMSGAEKLLGRGDMLFKPNDSPEPRRVQGAYVSSSEVSAVVKYIKANNPTSFDDGALKEITAVPEQQEQKNNSSNDTQSFDPVLKDALRWFISANQASITMIQRRFTVGYARAARIIDQMEQMGFISQQDGSKPRQVLITIEEFNELFPN